MPDRDDCIQPEPQPTDWTDDGIFRAAFLALFDPVRREVLRRAGAILAAQAISGDTDHHPVFGTIAAAAEELRMAERLLLEIAAMPEGSDLPDHEVEACEIAGHLARKAAEIASEVEAWAEPEEGAEPCR